MYKYTTLYTEHACALYTRCNVNSTHFSASFEVGQPLLKDDKHESKQSHDQAMASVSKHHSKQEREGDDSVGSCKKDRSMLKVNALTVLDDSVH